MLEHHRVEGTATRIPSPDPDRQPGNMRPRPARPTERVRSQLTPRAHALAEGTAIHTRDLGVRHLDEATLDDLDLHAANLAHRQPGAPARMRVRAYGRWVHSGGADVAGGSANLLLPAPATRPAPAARPRPAWQHRPVSFDLTVLAVDPPTTAAAVREQAARCDQRVHAEGELDGRIVAFYEALREEFPDFPPYSDETPWASMPLGAGIDHISMCLRYGSRSDAVIPRILDLAELHDLVVYDPQDGSVYVPSPHYLPPDAEEP